MNASRVFLGVFALLLAGAGQSTAVYYSIADPGGFGSDPVAVSASGPGYLAEASLATGFKTYAEVPGSDSVSVGILPDDPLVITNTGATAFTIAAGALSAHITASYSLVGQPPGTLGDSTAAATTSGSLQAEIRSGENALLATYSAAGQHDVGMRWVDTVLQPPLVSQTADLSTNGGAATFSIASVAGLDLLLTLPAITLNPGDTLLLSYYQLSAAGVTGIPPALQAISDASHSGYLQLVLPAGALYSTSAGVDLPWVTTVPLPGGALLMISGLTSLMLRGRRRDGHRRPDAPGIRPRWAILGGPDGN